MGLFSYFKRRRKTFAPGFGSYKSSLRLIRRKAIVPKHNYYENAQNGKPSRNIRRFEAFKARASLYTKVFIALFLSGAAVYVIFFTDFFTIEKIEIKGGQETLEEQKVVNDYLQEYLGGNILAFNANAHEENLMKDLNYLKTLQIYRVLPRTVIAKLETYPPAANIKIDSRFYVVNELGYISNIGVANETLPTISMDVTGTDLEITEDRQINAQIIPADALKSIIESKTSFEGKFNLQILETEYLKRARELHFYTELHFYVWIDMTQDIDIQLAKMKKALTKLNIYETPLEYIDLRVSGRDGEKVIYKLR